MTPNPYDIFYSTLGEFLNPSLSPEFIAANNFIGIANFGLIVVLILFGLSISDHLDFQIPFVFIIAVFGVFGLITAIFTPPGLKIGIFIIYSIVFKIISGGFVGRLAASNIFALILLLLAIVAFLLLRLFSGIIPKNIQISIVMFLIVYSILSVFKLALSNNAPGILGNIFFSIGIALIICIGTFAPLSHILENPISQSKLQTLLDKLFLKYSYPLGMFLGAFIELTRKKS